MTTEQLQARKTQLVQQVNEIRQQIGELTVLATRTEGAILMLEELLGQQAPPEAQPLDPAPQG